jgi:hypothetical protein
MNTDPNTHSLDHGKEFHKKHENVKQRKNKGKKQYTKEGFRGSQEDYDFYTSTNNVKQQSQQLLDKNNDIQAQVEKIEALEDQYDSLVKQYNQTQSSLISVTKKYADTNDSGGNVYVSKVVNNPTATYEGVYKLSIGMDTRILGGGQQLSYDDCIRAASQYNAPVVELVNASTINNKTMGFCLSQDSLTTATNLGESTSACNNGADGNIYGGPNVNAVYQVPNATYVNTFNDSPNRAMPFSNRGRQVDNYETCRAQAVKGGYQFFALQNGSMNGGAQCCVSNDYNKATGQGVTSNSFVAKDGYTYGGGWANALYQVETATPTYVGCFNDNPSKPAMTPVNGGSAIYSVDTCQQAAQAAGSKYFAVQGTHPGGSKCFIGNNLTAVKQYGEATPFTTGKDGKIYGTSGNIAIYSLNQTDGDPSVVGKLGYVDENGKLSEYPSSMNLNGTVKDNNSSCPKNVTAIDSIQWKAYPNSGTSMSPATVCGLASAKEKDKKKLQMIEGQMNAISNQIIQSTYTLQSYNSELLTQMGVDKQSLEANLNKYKQTNDLFSKYQKNYINNTNGLLDDTDIMVNQESYTYMLWAIGAIISIMIVLILFVM